MFPATSRRRSPLDDILAISHDGGELVQLLLRQLVGPEIGIETGLRDDSGGQRRPDPVHVAQGVRKFLVSGYINS